MADFYTPEQRKLQQDFGTQHLAASHTETIFPGAQMVVEARVDSIFLNCGRYIHWRQYTDQPVN